MLRHFFIIYNHRIFTRQIFIIYLLKKYPKRDSYFKHITFICKTGLLHNTYFYFLMFTNILFVKKYITKILKRKTLFARYTLYLELLHVFKVGKQYRYYSDHCIQPHLHRERSNVLSIVLDRC